MHGGSAPQVLAAAAERVLDVQVRATLARLDVDAVNDPFTELSKLAGQIVAWKNSLANKVNELTILRYSATGAGTEQLRAEVAMYERALDRTLAVLNAMARLNIDERMARITERQADTLIRALNAAFAEAGITGQAAIEARKVVARHLRAVEA